MFSLIPHRKENSKDYSVVPQARHPFNRIREEFDALFDRFLGNWMTPFEDAWTWPGSLGLELDENDKEFSFRTDAPGFEAGDFDVQVNNNWLVIRAEHREESEKEGQHRSERSFYRCVALPPGGDANQIEARYRNGVLEVRVPKTPEAQGRRIEVKS